ncbi:hypothetical protein LC76P1_00081 [Lysinibacillus phage LC76P1]|nr:hypothetical protein LC76P1_00081 [Lysinibacillus phage LC76P1]
MIINEFTRLVRPEIPIAISVVFLVLVISLSFLALVKKSGRVGSYLLGTLGAGLLTLLAYGAFFQKFELHQYYKYNDYGEVEDLQIIGWEVVANYENRKIAHIRKEE